MAVILSILTAQADRDNDCNRSKIRNSFYRAFYAKTNYGRNDFIIKRGCDV